MVSEHFPLQTLWANIFYFCRFLFSEKKNRVVTFQKFSVYFCAKFVEKGCISDFLSEKYPIWKKKSSKTESGRWRYWSFKIYNFSGFFLRTVTWFIFVAVGGKIFPIKLHIWVPLTISPNFKKKISWNGVWKVKLWAF